MTANSNPAQRSGEPLPTAKLTITAVVIFCKTFCFAGRGAGGRPDAGKRTGC